MAEPQKIDTGEDCEICGDSMVVYTSADQSQNEGMGWAWAAEDGDKAECPGCGVVGWVSVSDQCAWLSYNEESEQYIKCYEKKWGSLKLEGPEYE